MNFVGIGTMELVVILAVALLALGPKRMVETSRSVGEFMRKLREQRDEFTSMVMDEYDEEPKRRRQQESEASAPSAPEGTVGRPKRLASASESSDNPEGAQGNGQEEPGTVDTSRSEDSEHVSSSSRNG
ncbi:MAG: Sec-independent protein translocase subunit TatA/TatB [Chloroflexota bacterium]